MRRIIVLFGIALLGLSACTDNEIQPEEKLVVCTTNIIGDALQILLQDDVNVVSLMGPGVDPHLYKASHKDLEYLQDAHIIVVNGLHLEGKMADVIEKLSRSKKIIVMSDGVESSRTIEISESVHDPHIWFDVMVWNEAIDHLSAELVESLPELAPDIKTRTSEYSIELNDLHSFVKEEITSIPENQRVLITAHDAFSYFGRAYGMEVKGLQGISTQSDYGLQDISSLVKFISERNIKAVFVETSVNDKPLLAVLEGVKESCHEVVIGGSLYSDALGGSDEPGNNYVNMVRHNVTTIVNALK